MCESFSDLGLLIQQHYLRDFAEIVTGLPPSVFFSWSSHTRSVLKTLFCHGCMYAKYGMCTVCIMGLNPLSFLNPHFHSSLVLTLLPYLIFNPSISCLLPLYQSWIVG